MTQAEKDEQTRKAYVEQKALELIRIARDSGMLVSIDLVTNTPLAMGNLNMLASVRPDRRFKG